MKRAASVFLALVLLVAVLPHTAKAETAQSHTIEADRVLIYNPLPYSENGNTMYSGTLQTPQEDVLPEGKPIFSPDKHKTGKDLTNGEKTGRTHDFWVCTDLITYRYDKRTFTLAAEGEHCYIWTLVDDSQAFTAEQTAAMLEQFESVIYESNTVNFGPFRDLGGDGKLHIVTYTMNSSSVCGFFDSYDLYTREEIEIIDPDDADSYNYLPIINVNTRWADHPDVVYCTLAHEFQHLILRSAVLASPGNEGHLGSEKSIGVWLNEGFSMTAEELSYPGSVVDQGYVDAFSQSDKVRFGMSYQNFDATSTDVGAYGQSFLFTQYLRLQCGESICGDILAYWRDATSYDQLAEERAIGMLLNEDQLSRLQSLCTYTDTVVDQIGSKAAVMLSKLALSFRLALLFKEQSGLFACGDYDASIPVYTGSGRKIEGGGALLIECDGSFTVPFDADSGLVFVGIRDNAVTSVYSVPDPEEGYYVIAAQYGDQWYAMPAAPASDRILRAITVNPNSDGTIDAKHARGAVFSVTRESDRYRFSCDDENGTYTLHRTGSTKQTLCVSEEYGTFVWTRFVSGTDRLQADGYYGRAILYGDYQNGFGYFASGYFDNASFAQPTLLRVNFTYGDANMDGRMSAADASLILRSLVGLEYLNEPMRLCADMDGDGAITAEDAVIILRQLVNLE